MINGKIHGLSGRHVEDIIRARNEDFKKVSRKTHESFEIDDEKELPCDFTGFELSKNANGYILHDQHDYLRNLEQLPMDSTFSQFRSMRMKLEWLDNTRPDCLFDI